VHATVDDAELAGAKHLVREDLELIFYVFI
jgi:hypothetical protein